MIGLELVVPGGSQPSERAAGIVLEETKSRGLLVGKGGLHGNVIRLAPPMTLTAEETGQALRILGESVAVADREVRETHRPDR